MTNPIDAPTAALSLSQVAQELGTDEVSVLRLIARGVFAATLVGQNYRVTPAAIADYLNRGAPDFKTIGDDNRTWFRHDPRKPDVQLRRALAAAAADQRPSDDQLRNARGGTIANPAMEFPIRRSAAIVTAADREIGGANPWEAMFKNMNASRETVDRTTLLDSMLADELHAAARRALPNLSTRQKPESRSEFQQLYFSRESYREATAAAAKEVAETTLRWHATEQVEVGPNDPPVKPVVVTYFIALADATNVPIQSRISSVIATAF